MRTQSAYQRVVDNTRTEYEGGPRMQERDTYEQDNCRYGDVMRMIREGRDDDYIVRLRPEFGDCRDVLAVYRKIADGTIHRGRARRGKSTRTMTVVGLCAEIIAGEMNGESCRSIAERLGFSVRQVEYYTRGSSTQSKRGRKR